MIPSRIFVAKGAVLVAALGTSTAFAQDVAPSVGSIESLETITVTAQKITERLIDTPIPISVVSTDALVKQDRVQLRDYYSQIPGLSLASDGNRTTVAIRGITTGIGNSPTVGITIDDVPVGPTTGTDFMTPEIDPATLQRVEVLRGPQGMLYGAASMGGLIRYVTTPPNPSETSGEVAASTTTIDGGGGGYGVRGAVNLPLLDDRLGLQASGFYRDDPGFITDVGQGRTQANSSTSEGGRAALLWEIAPDVRATVAALYQNRTTDGSAAELVGDDYVPIYGRYKTSNVPGTETADTTLKLYTATVEVGLGFAKLSSISAYSEIDFIAPQDATDAFVPSVFPVLPLLFPTTYSPEILANSGVAVVSDSAMRKFSQEVRLASEQGGRVNWLLGAFYTDESMPGTQDVIVKDRSTGATVGVPRLIHLASGTDYQEWAVFGSLTFNLTDRFDLQVGGRYSEQKQHNTLSYAGSPFYDALEDQFGAPPPAASDLRSDQDVVTYSFTPRYHITADMMLYARVATGFRPGGANSPDPFDASAVPAEFSNDETTNYELGFKGNVIEDLLMLDVAAYYIDWQDIQLLGTSPSLISYTTNGAEARSVGAELTAQLTPVQDLVIALNLAYSNAELTRDPPAAAGIQASDGDRLPLSAKFTGNATVTQSFQINSDLTATVGATYTYVGDRLGYYIPTGSTVARFVMASYQTVDLQAGMEYNDWSVALYARNVGNEHGAVSEFRRNGSTFEGAHNVQLITPRSYGLSLTRRF